MNARTEIRSHAMTLPGYRRVQIENAQYAVIDDAAMLDRGHGRLLAARAPRAENSQAGRKA